MIDKNFIETQGIFEGTKAYRRDDGRLFLFRPQQNAMRMQIGAKRMCMPSPSIDQFVDAVKQTALANKRFVIFLSFKLHFLRYEKKETGISDRHIMFGDYQRFILKTCLICTFY